MLRGEVAESGVATRDVDEVRECDPAILEPPLQRAPCGARPSSDDANAKRSLRQHRRDELRRPHGGLECVALPACAVRSGERLLEQ